MKKGKFFKYEKKIYICRIDRASVFCRRVLEVLASCGLLDRVRAGAAIIKSSSGILPEQGRRYLLTVQSSSFRTNICYSKEQKHAMILQAGPGRTLDHDASTRSLLDSHAGGSLPATRKQQKVPYTEQSVHDRSVSALQGGGRGAWGRGDWHATCSATCERRTHDNRCRIFLNLRHIVEMKLVRGKPVARKGNSTYETSAAYNYR
ncbi:hypothetical protein F511_31285 [Dorcoceras hygrometricum]|uniref:Uncharacterized protein n=1 Tax=Dorcoceras hygrometricum TaxID=472368 RepID=A0A2Z7B8Q2_9LAMI|nr:hypothetical protein F511_31285 [Dorcoceras hygrometricum]